MKTIRKLSYALVLSLTSVVAIPLVSHVDIAQAKGKGGAVKFEAVHKVKPGEVPHVHAAPPAGATVVPDDGPGLAAPAGTVMAPGALDTHAPGAPDALHNVRQGGATPGAQ